MRKSIKLVPGVRLNVSKRGVGISAGAGGARYSVHSSGRRTVAARTGIPGVNYQKSVSGGRRRSSGGPARAARGTLPSPPPASPTKPGLFAPKGEKELFKAIREQNTAAIQAVGEEHPRFRVASFSLAGAMLLSEDHASAERLLSDAFASGADPAEDPFVRKYVLTQLTLNIAPGVAAELPLNRDAIGLALAELKQAHGDLTGAIDVVEQLEPTTYAAVSLAELYVSANRYNDVVELTQHLLNEDDTSALLLVYRAVALRESGYFDAAHEAFKEALRSRSRAAPIRHLALFERAHNYRDQGKKAMARKDLERILAEDASYEGVREQLSELAAS